MVAKHTTIYWCRCMFCDGTGKREDLTTWWSHKIVCDHCGGCGKIYALDLFGERPAEGKSGE